LRLCIFGTRTFYKNQAAARIIDRELETLQPELIVTTGDADGICRLAIDKARKHSIPCEIHFLNQAQYARGMYEHRSLSILKRCDFVLFIHDGTSQGTKNEMNQADQLKIPYKYFKIKPEKPKDILSELCNVEKQGWL
jgi:hypothetical protein